MYNVKIELYDKETGECLRKKVLQAPFKRTILASLGVILDNYIKDGVNANYVFQIDNLSASLLEQKLAF